MLPFPFFTGFKAMSTPEISASPGLQGTALTELQALLGDRADTQDIADAFDKVARLSGQLRWKAIDRKLRSGVKKLLRMN